MVIFLLYIPRETSLPRFLLFYHSRSTTHYIPTLDDTYIIQEKVERPVHDYDAVVVWSWRNNRPRTRAPPMRMRRRARNVDSSASISSYRP